MFRNEQYLMMAEIKTKYPVNFNQITNINLWKTNLEF